MRGTVTCRETSHHRWVSSLSGSCVKCFPCTVSLSLDSIPTRSILLVSSPPHGAERALRGSVTRASSYRQSVAEPGFRLQSLCSYCRSADKTCLSQRTAARACMRKAGESCTSVCYLPLPKHFCIVISLHLRASIHKGGRRGIMTPILQIG